MSKIEPLCFPKKGSILLLPRQNKSKQRVPFFLNNNLDDEWLAQLQIIDFSKQNI